MSKMEDSKKKLQYFPNQCFACESRNISRCTKCQMIAYCSEEHQSQHWNEHKTLCKVITKLLIEQKIFYIYENVDKTIWLEEIKRIINEVETKLKRSLKDEEKILFYYPRVCFICRETKQEKLRSCLNCPAASFCSIHSRSHIHNRYCLSTEVRDWNNALVDDENTLETGLSTYKPSFVKCFIKGTRILKNDDNIPVSMKEFFESYVSTRMKNSHLNNVYMSECFSTTLTLFSALKTIFNNSIPSTIVIHLKLVYYPWMKNDIYCFESLLHLMPQIKNLRIVLIEDMNRDHITENIPLCFDCRLKNKNLKIERSFSPTEKPSLVAVLNGNPPLKSIFLDMGWITTNKEAKSCPLLLTFLTESLSEMKDKELQQSPVNFRIIYNGYNEFTTLIHRFVTPDGYSNRTSQFMTILQLEENFEHKYLIDEKQYYSQICQVCRKPNARTNCNYCHVTFYCGKQHLNEDCIHHRDLCQVVYDLKIKRKEKYLFANSKNFDSYLWLRERCDLLDEVELRLKRKLKRFEEEMFLFPKACGICHDCYASLLKSCKCGTHLCKIHQNDPRHEKVCPELSIAFKMFMSEAIVDMNFSLLGKTSISKTKEDSIQAFMDITFASLKEITNTIFKGKIPLSMKQLNYPLIDQNEDEKDNFSKTMSIVKILSAPLTLFHALENLGTKINSSMIIHIIGANRADFEKKFLWAFLFYEVEQLENLKIIFIGAEFPNYPETQIISNFPWMKINLKIEGHSLDYDQYIASENFVKPDIILGCDLNIHERRLTSEKYWKKTISSLGKVGVPFVFTSGTKKRAKKDHEKICDILGKSVNFEFLEKNPFASICPERDFETEGVLYSNLYITAYREINSQFASNSLEKEKISEKINENLPLGEKIFISEENCVKTEECLSEAKKIEESLKSGLEKIEIDENSSDEIKESFVEINGNEKKEIPCSEDNDFKTEENVLKTSGNDSKIEQNYAKTKENDSKTKEYYSETKEIDSKTEDYSETRKSDSKTKEIISEIKKNENQKNEIEKIEPNSESLNDENELEVSSDSLLKERNVLLNNENKKLREELELAKNEIMKARNALLDIENQKLREKLDLAKVEIMKLNNRLLDLKKIYANFVQNNIFIKETLNSLEDGMNSLLSENETSK